MSRLCSLCVLLSVAVAAACSDGTGPAPVATVTGVSPDHGPLTGGTVVRISGTNFLMTIDSVRVGAGRLEGMVWTSSTSLRGTTPTSGATGAVDVTVYTTGSGSGTCASCFTYTLPVTWISLAAGGNHTCGLASGGAAYCWGRNFGALGDGDWTWARSAPVAVAGGLAFASLTAGNGHSCGLTSGGTAYCWGNNLYGQVGRGDTLVAFTPVAVAGGLTFANVTADYDHTCGVTTNGAAYCWGLNALGRLGDGTTTSRTTPAAVAGGLAFASLAAGGLHTCGLTSGGAAYCWGNGRLLGTGDTVSRATPMAVAGGIAFASLAAGGLHTCGLTSGGVAYCWGYNGAGGLGDGSTADRSTPVAVGGGFTFAGLFAGEHHTCGLTSSGVAYCWGWNGSGQIGFPPDGTPRTTPVPVAGGLRFASLAPGRMHTCGVTTGGAAYCWGYNAFGQLGDGSTNERYGPVVVVDP